MPSNKTSGLVLLDGMALPYSVSDKIETVGFHQEYFRKETFTCNILMTIMSIPIQVRASI